MKPRQVRRHPEDADSFVASIENDQEALETWSLLSEGDRVALIGWVARPWTGVVRKRRALAVLKAARGGPDSLANWDWEQRIRVKAHVPGEY